MSQSWRLLQSIAMAVLIAGARQEILIGAFAGDQGWKMNEVVEMEKWQGKKMAVLTLFTDFCSGAMGNLFDQQLPNIYKNGNTPIISWMPIDCPEKSNILAQIAAGNYDGYIRDWAGRLKNLMGANRKAFIRFGHEMNGNWYSYSPHGPNSQNTAQDYIAAWKKIYGLFRSLGLNSSQVPFIFCPISHDKSGNVMEQFYPGNDVVEWLGVDAYNWGHAESWSAWTSISGCVDQMVNRLRALNNSKPLALSEVGTTSVAYDTGSKSASMKGQWITDFCQYLINRGFGMVNYFNIDKETDWAVFGSSLGTAQYNGKNVYKEYKDCIMRNEFVSSGSGQGSTPPDNGSTPPPATKGRTFKSNHGSYLRGYPDGKVDLAQNAQAWEMWTWNYLPNGKFTWRSSHGTYLRANPDGRVDLAQVPREWEQWTKIKVGNLVAWKSFHGTYLRGYPDGRVDLAPSRQTWELWDS